MFLRTIPTFTMSVHSGCYNAKMCLWCVVASVNSKRLSVGLPGPVYLSSCNSQYWFFWDSEPCFQPVQNISTVVLHFTQPHGCVNVGVCWGPGTCCSCCCILNLNFKSDKLTLELSQDVLWCYWCLLLHFKKAQYISWLLNICLYAFLLFERINNTAFFCNTC